MLALAVMLVVFQFVRAIGKKHLMNKAESDGPDLSLVGVSDLVLTGEEEGVWQDGRVKFDGIIYTYNEGITTFLIMGIDKDSYVESMPEEFTIKKFVALALTGAMLLSVPVMASNSPTSGTTSPSASSATTTPEIPAVPAVTSTPAPAVVASSVPAVVVAAAEAEGKTVGEYMNNAVVSIPGLTEVAPLGQGGHVIINGVPSNQVFSVLKPAADM